MFAYYCNIVLMCESGDGVLAYNAVPEFVVFALMHILVATHDTYVRVSCGDNRMWLSSVVRCSPFPYK